MKKRHADEYGTTPVILEVLRGAGRPLKTHEILELAGDTLPTRATHPDTRRNVVARDLVREIARGDEARVRRLGPGLFEAVSR